MNDVTKGIPADPLPPELPEGEPTTKDDPAALDPDYPAAEIEHEEVTMTDADRRYLGQAMTELGEAL